LLLPPTSTLTMRGQSRSTPIVLPTDSPAPVRNSKQLLKDDSPIESIAFSPDGKGIATGGGKRWPEGQPGVVKLWSIANGREIRSFVGHTDTVQLVTLSPDGRLLASAGRDSKARVWDVATGQGLFLQTWDTDSNITFSPDGKTMVFGFWLQGLTLWNTTTWKQVLEFKSPGLLRPESSAFFPDGKTLVTGDFIKTGTVTFWNVSTGEYIRSLSGHSLVVNSVAISPDGKLLATGSRDLTVKIWDILSGKVLFTFTHDQGVCRAEFSPDGKWLATREDMGGWVRLWDVKTGKQIRLFNVPYLSPSVCGMAFTPDGRMLATSSQDGTVVLWDLSTLR
jgi:WD40 repeat protein